LGAEDFVRSDGEDHGGSGFKKGAINENRGGHSHL